MIRAMLGKSRLRRDENGAVTIDFVLVFPLFVMLLMMSVEAGILMTRHVMVDRALDMTVRELRLGVMVNPDHDTVKASVCNKTVIMPHCMRDLRLEMRSVDRDTWNVFDGPATCVDRSLNLQPPAEPFNHGGENELVLLRACALFDPFFPTTGIGLRLPKDPSGTGYQMVAMTAFVNEPRF